MKSYKQYLAANNEFGTVTQVHHPLALVDGLPSVKNNELVVFDSGLLGQVTGLRREAAEVLLLSNEPAAVGQQVTLTQETLMIACGSWLKGQAITSMGRPLVGSVPLNTDSVHMRPVDVEPRTIEVRTKIRRPFETGMPMVDMLLPLGYGQRELVVGDKKTGKTSFVLGAARTQSFLGTKIVYAAIGKRWGEILKLREFVETETNPDNVTLVVSHAHDPSSLIHLTPYTAMTVAEYWIDEGHDVLLILDDMSTHARFYREIALLSKRFPGRESYPGDMFHTHARLLERAGNFIHVKGGSKTEVSITCLPVAESVQSNLTSHIVSNLISITDGHLLFDSAIKNQGRNPAIDNSLSVTRLGRFVQTKVASDLYRGLTNLLVKHHKALEFTQFGAELSEESKQTLTTGDMILSFLSQDLSVSVPYSAQLVFAAMIWMKWLELSDEDIQEQRACFVDEYRDKKKVRSLVDQLAVSEDLEALRIQMDRNKNFLMGLCQVLPKSNAKSRS